MDPQWGDGLGIKCADAPYAASFIAHTALTAQQTVKYVCGWVDFCVCKCGRESGRVCGRLWTCPPLMIETYV